MHRLAASEKPLHILTSLCLAAGERCPRCLETRYYPLRDGRRRCPSCGYTYHLFTGRFVNRVRLTPRGWLRMLDVFWKGKSVQEAADALAVKYDTAHKAYASARLALLCAALGPGDAGRILDEAGELIGFCPNLENEGEQTLCQGCRSYVFALARDDHGRASLSLVRGLAARETLASPLGRKPWGTMVYTDRFREYEALFFSCCRKGRELFLREPCERPFPVERQDGFIEAAGPWMARYRAISPQTYPLYLAEMLFRYNHGTGEAVTRLAGALCRFVPKRGD